jgi:hypothetical protein
VASCNNPLRAGLFICPSCWRRVPKELKAEFRRAAKGEPFFSICRVILGVLADERDSFA